MWTHIDRSRWSEDCREAEEWEFEEAQVIANNIAAKSAGVIMTEAEVCPGCGSMVEPDGWSLFTECNECVTQDILDNILIAMDDCNCNGYNKVSCATCEAWARRVYNG